MTTLPSAPSRRRLVQGLIIGLVFILAVSAIFLHFRTWRQGTIVAEAEFDPGIAPFRLTVRRVPVPVTRSEHFIVEVTRGEYVVTSFRYFWPDYTPRRVSIDWPCIERFTVRFDDAYLATAEWDYGSGAVWTLKSIGPGGKAAGQSPYYFEPRRSPPPHCKPWR